MIGTRPRASALAALLSASLLAGCASTIPADLTIGGGSVIPVVNAPGETLGVAFTLTNLGPGGAHASCVGVSVRPNSGPAYDLGTIDAPALAPGADARLSGSVALLPLTIPPGDAILVLTADADGRVHQSDTTNDEHEVVFNVASAATAAERALEARLPKGTPY